MAKRSWRFMGVQCYGFPWLRRRPSSPRPSSPTALPPTGRRGRPRPPKLKRFLLVSPLPVREGGRGDGRGAGGEGPGGGGGGLGGGGRAGRLPQTRLPAPFPDRRSHLIAKLNPRMPAAPLGADRRCHGDRHLAVTEEPAPSSQ